MFVLGQRSLGYEGPPEDHLRDHTHVSLFVHVSLFMFHFFPLPLSSCIRTVSDPNPCHIQDPLSVCGSRVYASGMTFLCTVFDQCHHHHCARICSSADYWRLASCSCPTCCTTVLPATPTKESQSSDMEPSHSTLSSMDSLSQRPLSIVPRSPAQMSTTAAYLHLRGQVLAFQLQSHRALPVASQNCKISFTTTRCWSPAC